ncbi:MAG: Methylated-DNA--protein-cysteine methyltransferase, partial [uncultured Nocardioidaceae bacterium]
DPSPHRPRQPPRTADRGRRGRPPLRPLRRAGAGQGARTAHHRRLPCPSRAGPGPAGGDRAAHRLLRPGADGVRRPARSRGDPLPAARVGGAARHPLRGDAQLRAARRRDRESCRLPGGGRGQRAEPGEHRRPLSPRRRQHRQADGLRRGAHHEGAAARPRAARRL